MKKLLSTIISLALSATILCACGSPQASPVEDFSYEFEDGTATITGYIGSDLQIVIPDEIDGRPVTRIEEEAFEDYDLESIVIPNPVVEIKSAAFRSCSNLKKCVLSESLEYIDYGAFSGCTSLETITIPNSVTEIGRNAFRSCENLKTVKMSTELLELYKDKFIKYFPNGNDGFYIESYYDEGIFLECPNVEINGIPISNFE